MKIVVCGRVRQPYRLGEVPHLPERSPAIDLPGQARIVPGARKGTGLSLVIPF